MKILKKVKLILWLIILIGSLTAAFDYYRVMNGKAPIFCIRNYNQNTYLETSRGLFYKVDRIVKQDKGEKYNLSSKIQYQILGFIIPIKLERPKQESDYVLYVTKEKECITPSLYIELDEYKIYLDCINSIKIKKKNSKETKELKDILLNEPSKINDLINQLAFMGIDEDKTTEIFYNDNDIFINQFIYLYKCHTEDVKDIYITTKDIKDDEYCIVKNDK